MKFLNPEPSRCEGVRACEKACSRTFFKVEKPEFSAIQIKKVGKSHEINVCNQCGVCISICPVKALYRNSLGTVMLKKDLCVGCFMCVGFCPTQAMRRAPGQKEPFKCVSCGACVKACPKGALGMLETDHANLPS